ncbi:hypothetical protein ES288_D12G127000v1 [Gossypium darwinii]|uniref:(+)-neomenthol dehydrogenase n=1 Tax=Gossypium darwinii TaxID=34276 RepID=A0A5D2A7L2_GOSDA|nr:hypothetical protein ES288_D12G127000v1 [Gossypium darwinii]
MADQPTKRYAVVTGSNRGIGFEICKQLATKGMTVVLTARDETNGVEAVGKLKQFGFSETVVFHRLDVTEPACFNVNNAGIGGVTADEDALRGGVLGKCETLLPLLHLSDSPRIINISSSMGQLKNISNEWAKAVLGDAENLTEDKVDQVLRIFMNDFKEDSLEAEGWPTLLATYSISKAAMNGYARVLAKKYPSFQINCVCPGSVKTDINYNTGLLPVEEGAESAVRLVLLPNNGPSGHFFVRMAQSEF